ncbi:hypothetical protein [Phenylobacterium sp.]|uniref:hypothetical protein n=1 Tax=Phenylobacterium sp. TaxID=1871053 RepID=UPI002810AC70|nr:hypothetical protein [Phenylobacterium sp.]
MQDPLAEEIARRYPAIAHELLRSLIDVLTIARQLCDGDLDKFLVMLAVGVRTAVHPEFAAADQKQLLSGEIPIFPTLGINTRSVSESLQIPKETTRRKVAELIELGWIHREGGRLHFTAEAYRTLAPLRVAVERSALRTYRTVDGVATEAGKGSRPRKAS